MELKTKNAAKAAEIYNSYFGSCTLWRDPKAPDQIIVVCQPLDKDWIDKRDENSDIECLGYHGAVKNGHALGRGKEIPVCLLFSYMKRYSR